MAWCPNAGGRVLMFLGGPCTLGLGQAVGTDLTCHMRSHHTINKAANDLPHLLTENEKICQFVEPASKYYKALGYSAATNGHTVDLFACSPDQVGLYEMKYCPYYTGGQMLLCDSFSSPELGSTLQRMFRRDAQGCLDMAFNATVQIKTSHQVKIAGVLSPCISAEEITQHVSDVEIGVGRTNKWKLCALTSNTTLALFLTITTRQPGQVMVGRPVLQIVTSYQNSAGHIVTRVTTVARTWSEPVKQSRDILPGLDCEAAAVMLAHLALDRTQEATDQTQWIDYMLIKLLQMFIHFDRKDPEKFPLHEQFKKVSLYLYHLRRSPLVQLDNTSPDMTTYYRYLLKRERVGECLKMIAPQLYSYCLNHIKQEVPLDDRSMVHDHILLLDTYFTVMVYWGKTISEWVKAGYHQETQYSHLKHMIDVVQWEAENIAAHRLPTPALIITHHGHSQGRILLAKVNPSQNYQSCPGSPSKNDGIPVLSDYIPFEKYLEKIILHVISNRK